MGVNVNGQPVELAEAVYDFVVLQKPSSNVEYFGYGPTGDIFLQFKNGSAYIYKNTSEELVKEMLAAESIGKFVAKLKPLVSVKQPGKLVTPVIAEGEQAWPDGTYRQYGGTYPAKPATTTAMVQGEY